ncbi:MAG: 6-phosphogluconolactonase [Chloroflexota bacterium]
MAASSTGSEGRPTILVADGPEAVSRVAADLLVAWLAGAIGERGVAHVALTGGSSAKGLYAALRAPSRAWALDWGRVHAWLGDDRFVPRVHPDSNGGLALHELAADGAGLLPAANLHLIPVEAAMSAGTGPAGAAAAYADEVLGLVPASSGVPVLDVVLVGVGGDGHLLSVFPGSEALASDAPITMGIPAPTHIQPHQPRVTFSPAILRQAGHVMPIVAGAAKAEVLGQIFGPERDPSRWPAQLALGPNATWLLDPAAAAGLPRR